jgi:hypothetical protein
MKTREQREHAAVLQRAAGLQPAELSTECVDDKCLRDVNADALSAGCKPAARWSASGRQPARS